MGCWLKRYFLISILFPLFRLPIRCLKNPILPSPNSHLENTQMVAISCFLRLWHSSPSSKARKTPSLESIDSFGEEEFGDWTFDLASKLLKCKPES
ncbi:hypothetical protein V6Z12_A12G043800 [Gossypium hirsutum]